MTVPCSIPVGTALIPAATSRSVTASGRSGVGGANDVVLYTATVSYTSFIPVGAALKISPTTTMKAATILRNQPFATEPSWNAVQVCT